MLYIQMSLKGINAYLLKIKENLIIMHICMVLSTGQQRNIENSFCFVIESNRVTPIFKKAENVKIHVVTIPTKDI